MGARTLLERVGIPLALIGVGLSIAAVWLDTVAEPSGGYWDDRSTAFYLLGVSSISGLLVARPSTRAWAAAGGLLLVGFHSFVPLVYAPDRLGELRQGAWLGLAGGALLAAGAGLASGVGRAGRRAPKRTRPVGIVLTVAGAALAYLAVWSKVLDVDPRTGLTATYWDFYVTGHELGMFVLVVTSLALGLVAVAPRFALVPALLLLGLYTVVPISSDVQHLDELGPGAWLGLAGGLLLVAGVASAQAVSRSSLSGSAPVRRHDSHSAA